jgi:hypothetical protein
MKIAVLTVMPQGIEFQVRDPRIVLYLEQCRDDRNYEPFRDCFIAYEGESNIKSLVNGSLVSRFYILEQVAMS